MKRCFVILVVSVFFVACVTNPYTESDYRYSISAPANQSRAVFTSLVPGWTQLEHGEKIEGWVYIIASFLSIGALATMMPEDGSTDLDMPEEYIAVATLGSVWITSYIDGVLTARQRSAQYVRAAEVVENERAIEREAIAKREAEREEANRLERERRAKEAEERRIAERAAYERDIRANIEFSDREKEAILHNMLFLGMSRKALIESWGPPLDINRTVGSFGTHEQFVYPGKSKYENVYVYLENGYITSWSD